jgi:DNA-binding SARP family transcriptional activator
LCPPGTASCALQVRRANGLEFRILGPLEVVEDGRPLRLGGKLPRTVLAALLVHAREFRTIDQLIDDVWCEHAPATARASLHNVVSSLRRALGADVLETTRCGYVFAVGEEAVDASRFERLVSRARDVAGKQKVDLLEEAFGLWRGSPLVDFRYDEFAQNEIRRLEELRVDALEELLSAKLELGAGTAVVPALRRLVDESPYRERPRMQLMVALHRSGRSVEALSSYLDWRRTLMDSWGIEPGRDIQQLWNDIRRHAVELEIATSA